MKFPNLPHDFMGWLILGFIIVAVILATAIIHMLVK